MTEPAGDAATEAHGLAQGWLGPFHLVSIFLAVGSASTAVMLWHARGIMQGELRARDIEPDGFVFFCDDWPLPAALVVHALAFLLKDLWVRRFPNNLLWNVALWLGASVPIAVALTLSQRQLVEALQAGG